MDEDARILVIDDDEGPRHVTAEMLGKAGHRVDTASSGMGGLALAQQKTYDLVIADLGMPDISGRHVAKVIKDVNPATPVLLITGWGVQLDPVEVKKDGVDDIIAKPFTKSEVLTKVAGLLSQSRESSHIRPERK